MQNSRFQFSLRGLLGYCALLALAMSMLRVSYVVELHGYLGLLCVVMGFILSGAVVGIPIGLAIGGKRGARGGAFCGAILLAICGFILPSGEVLWDGSFNLTVNLVSNASLIITKIEYLEVASRRTGDLIVQNPRSADGSYQPATDFDNKRFTAEISCFGRRIGIFGYETNYGEFRFVVVHLQYQNGEHKYMVAEIPAGRGDRSMTLTVP
jgi:hypothetical protein